MPKYLFECSSCGKKIHKYVPSSVTEVICDTCQNAAVRQLPILKGQTEVREVVDPYTNVTWEQNQSSLIKERKETYYWQIEVPRLVQTYSLETCLENKWLTYNEKGELVINKPPSKR